MSNIVERIERELGIPGLATILAQRLTRTDLQSLLLEVYHLRLIQMQPADVLSDYQNNRFVKPSRSSPLKMVKWEQIAFEHLPAEFQALELSPVCPLGTNSSVAPIDPNWSVATIRNSEVVSDSTNVLALECALQRKELLETNPKSNAAIHLAARHRLLRTQYFQNPKLVAHYHLLCFHIHATTSAGHKLELADGGVLDWTQKFLSNAKERLVASGIGSERLCNEF